MIDNMFDISLNEETFYTLIAFAEILRIHRNRMTLI